MIVTAASIALALAAAMPGQAETIYPTIVPKPAPVPRPPLFVRVVEAEPYEAAVESWKQGQYRCMKRGRACFAPHPNRSDFLPVPPAR